MVKMSYLLKKWRANSLPRTYIISQRVFNVLQSYIPDSLNSWSIYLEVYHNHLHTLLFHRAGVFDIGGTALLFFLSSLHSSFDAGIIVRTAAEESGLPEPYDGRKTNEFLADYPENRATLAHRAKTELSYHNAVLEVMNHALFNVVSVRRKAESDLSRRLSN